MPVGEQDQGRDEPPDHRALSAYHDGDEGQQWPAMKKPVWTPAHVVATMSTTVRMVGMSDIVATRPRAGKG